MTPKMARWLQVTCKVFLQKLVRTTSGLGCVWTAGLWQGEKARRGHSAEQDMPRAQRIGKRHFLRVEQEEGK